VADETGGAVTQGAASGAGATGSRTRLALMLPGAVSLGAYEGGALAAILTAAQHAGGELVIDAIGSASAGSITALVAIKAIFDGSDPVQLMRKVWVELPSIENLKTHDPIAPLTMHQLEVAADEILAGPVGDPLRQGVGRQSESVRLSMAVTVLGGLAYRLASLEDHPADGVPLDAQTFTDFVTATIEATSFQSSLREALAGALASGANPLGFAPRLMDRSDAADGYTRNGILNPGVIGHMWCSDGGDIDNEPFGKVLDLIGAVPLAPNERRAIAVLQMQPATVESTGKWFDPAGAHVPTWTSTLLRVTQVRQVQSYYDDLRRLEKANSRLRWVAEVAERLSDGVEALVARLPAAEQSAARADFDASIAAAHDSISADVAAIRDQLARSPAATSGTPAQASDNEIGTLLMRAAGLEGKQRVRVEVIAPDPADGPAASQLAGEFLFHFGGFLDQRFRESDFALGYKNATQWLERFLAVDHAGILSQVSAALAAGARQIGDVPDMGSAGLGTLSLHEDAEAAELIAHIIHVFEYGFRHDVHTQR
jgi:hypothetical protein